MQVNSLAETALAQMPKMAASVSGDIAVALLSQQLDVSRAMGEDMIKAMEHSVNPDIGGNVDVYA